MSIDLRNSITGISITLNTKRLASNAKNMLACLSADNLPTSIVVTNFSKSLR